MVAHKFLSSSRTHLLMYKLQLYIPNDPQSIQLRNTTTTTECHDYTLTRTRVLRGLYRPSQTVVTSGTDELGVVLHAWPHTVVPCNNAIRQLHPETMQAHGINLQQLEEKSNL